MFLVIDAGNTRTKYGCHTGQGWLLETVWHGGVFELPAGFAPERIVIASVASAEHNTALAKALAPLNAPVEWMRASATRCGVRCDYAAPASLGPDRWAAAIAAWHRVQRDCVVVCAGTASTIDIVRSPGIYAGGSILPGLSMMFDALASGTAALPAAHGQLALPARNTHDAIHTGCLLAHVGAIKETAAILPPGSPILVTGGAAEHLLPLLGPAAESHPWLDLDGLLAIAREHTLTSGSPTC